ncbi:hypothetical protein CRUP_018315 [Coryphaenoides rupestris]|nr:hypothetical protein CRUP_018315 [Coryphaenoides rupestris]
MADISLDEVIRQRGLNAKQQTMKRPMFGRGAGSAGRGFDARQKIGANDVRQRIGTGAGFQVKDAREKLGQKDARFRIRGGGGGGGGGVQDARQMINSRKQVHNQLASPPQTQVHPHPHMAAGQHHLMNHISQMHIHGGPVSLGGSAVGLGRQFPQPGIQAAALGLRGGPMPSKPLDARDRLSLKRSMGTPQSQVAAAAPFKITKTIQRGLNAKQQTMKRPMFGRGAGSAGRGFDARQKIGANDVRQRIGTGAGFQVKDAREKLGQKDARFRIRGGGGGGGGGVQDARQMINSRKQVHNQLASPPQTQVHPHPHMAAGQHHLMNHISQMHIHGGPVSLGGSAVGLGRQFPQPGIQAAALGLRGGPMPSKPLDARDRLSLKRSMGTPQSQVAAAAPFKITKTIQQRPVGMSSGIRLGGQSFAGEHDGIPAKQMKITTSNNNSNNMLQSRPGTMGSPFSMSAPITKVVKNDAYTAPRAPVPVAPTRPSSSPTAFRSSSAALKPVSRTLQQAPAAPSPLPAAPPQLAVSPLEGTKITVNNLHPRVTEEDIVELFCVCGALKRARLVKVGVAEVVFVRKDDAVSAYRKYNNRCLDGQPMKCNLHIQGNVITSDQPILLRLSDTPGGGAKRDGLPPSLSRPAGQRSSSQPTPEVDPQTILKALFKSPSSQASPTSSSSAASNSQATAFRIKI